MQRALQSVVYVDLHKSTLVQPNARRYKPREFSEWKCTGFTHQA
ncbi:hypothetical protein PITC_035600 [Penicillium italicum]|uniref:Uncharacterized protein n=1 Tax=Penicillium italicum TaxID=40296 RepID=A0A0A2L1E5_PENIT|nr:hypothetical protein PITC_035600 [Penicillium italicum]